LPPPRLTLRNASRPVVLLGPQRFQPTVATVLDDLGIRGTVAAVTAGWEERELEDGELREHLGRETVNLRLFWRLEDVFREDPGLKKLLYERYGELRELRRIHQIRLSHQLEAARTLMQENGDDALLDPERSSAIEELRHLDAFHLHRVREVHAAYDARIDGEGRESLARQRAELGEILSGAAVLAIAGGHVGVLTNRLRLFGILERAPALPVIAWSAGAMALSERIVLFHDRPPQGFGNPEILEHGLGHCPGVVPLPHANKRLRLEDPIRVALFARRFAPARCVLLTGGDRWDWNGEEWHGHEGTRVLTREGAVIGAGAS
jgi:hypothetical protein